MNFPPVRLIPSLVGACCLFLLTACGGGSGAPAPGSSGNSGPPVSQPPGSGPALPPPQHSITGDVFSFDTGMLANVDVNLWVQTPGLGYSYWWAYGPLRTDALGQFLAFVPNSVIFVTAFKDGFVQPCAAYGGVIEDTEVHVEMISASSLNALNPLRPQTSHEPSVTGFVFENTANGRQPVAGAHFWAESPMEVVYATTFSDLSGGFYLCNLPQDTQIGILKSGFKPYRTRSLDTSQSLVLEIELERE